MKTPTQHTFGPWATSRDAVPIGHVQITVYAESDGERVATAFRTEANARLIAAAPDLLEALIDVLGWMDGIESSGEQLASANRARAAIAKATEPTP